MLITEKSHELPPLPFLTGSGETAWRTVTLHPHIPYVFISYECREGGAKASRTSIVWRHEDILSFCDEVQRDKERKILSVCLLLSAGSGASQRWSWHPVKEISSGKFEESGMDFPFYVTENGDRFGGLGDLQQEDTLEDLKRVYP